MEEEFKIVPVEEIPKAKKKLRESLYDKILETIMSKPKGYYKIETKKKMKSVYVALQKRITERKLPLKLRVRSNELYVEKLQ